METLEQKKKRANDLYNLARLAGIVTTQREFADFLGINENTVGRALKGGERYLTDNFFMRIENAFNEAGISIDGNNTAPVNNQQGENLVNTQESPSDLGKVIDEMKAQREMYDRQFTEVLKQNSQLIQIIAKQNG